jgi:protein-S-isoprenylcysteine O-methyltransferase Ste14
MEQLTIAEAAERLRITREACKSRIHRGRALLREYLQGDESDGSVEGEVGMSSQPRVSGTPVQRAMAVLGSAVFFVVAPCTLAGLVPWSITGWHLQPPFLGLELTRGIGAIMILTGVPGLVDAFARFALQGLGTPAPIAPTRNLVVTGLYRYVRNPIYVAVVAIILGQAVLMGDSRLIVYGALLWLGFHVFVVTYEEPTLEETFGSEYEAFRAAVPRWIARLTPWRPESK